MNHDMVIKYGPREPRRTPKLPIPKKEEPTIKDLQEEIERLKKRVKKLERQQRGGGDSQVLRYGTTKPKSRP